MSYNDTETKAITAENNGSLPVYVSNGGYVNISVAGTFTATITLQRSFDSDPANSATWRDVSSYTSATETTFLEGGKGTFVRLWCKTGGFTSGTANVRISYHGVGSK